MTMRMLIDARHREETRVAVVKGNRIEEFDFESAERKQLKGNIYLAKVTRVEPSLQAAFIEYGGNRHGFLAFSEIHPDYYQIPKEDREALLREEAEHAAEEAALREEADDEDHDHDDEHEHDHDDHGDVELVERAEEDEEGGEHAEGDEPAEGEGGNNRRRRGRGRKGSDDQVEALRQRRMSLRRRYKIQDVIRRRQVLLVQVVKEERGNKGAALTTYLSLAGRYCVLMPNTAHGGGISRKISSSADRKRLKSIMSDLKLPPTMGCIVRTAGLQRTKTEIKRDFDYLARLWDEIREKTLASAAPALVYGDSDLIKRAIRDIYNRDIEEVIVEGEEGYRHAKDFMKLLMPSHAKKVKHYSDAVPLFQRAHVEDQLSAMYHPVVQLKSGGYLVINPTEALVSIDINSGRSTREHNIEQTATATNLEATQEIARQLRLRDMAGLVVIDFIDMDHGSNVRKVEKAMKEALKNDRARIQVGRISPFGLMEMSRQRLRTGVLEASTVTCPHCEGTGLVRTASSAGLSALRLIEDEAARGRGSLLTLRCSQEAAFYVLNKKRADIAEIEDRYGVTVEILSDGELEGARMSVEASGPPPAYAPKFVQIVEEVEDDIVEEIDEEEEEEEVEAREPRERRERSEGEGEGGRKRRRRRRGRGRRRDGEQGENGEAIEAGEADDGDADADADAGETAEASTPIAAEAGEDDQGEGRKRRRRGRRGGRRGAGDEIASDEGAKEAAETVSDAEAPAAEPTPISALDQATLDAGIAVEPQPATDEAPAKPKRTRRKKADADAPPAESTPIAALDQAALDAGIAVEPQPATDEAPAKPKRTRRKKADVEAVAEAAPAEAPVAEAEPAPAEEAPKPKRRSRAKAATTTEAAPVAQDLAPAPAEAAPVAPEAPADDAVAEGEAEGGEPRRGWWQRTFGA